MANHPNQRPEGQQHEGDCAEPLYWSHGRHDSSLGVCLWLPIVVMNQSLHLAECLMPATRIGPDIVALSSLTDMEFGDSLPQFRP